MALSAAKMVSAWAAARKAPYLQVLILTLYLAYLARCDTDFGDPVVNGRRTLSLQDSPYLVGQDVLVDSTGELIIEPGVEVRFKPEVGITVRGVLRAQGNPSKKIRFVPANPVVERQPNRTVRLVDGPSVNEGIIQVLELGYWRSVCTNSRNWTQADMEVACKQLGFTGGEWYHWYPHLNDTKQMLYQEPGCSGYEPRIELCQWQRRKMGSGTCDLHPNLGLRCLPFHHPEAREASGHWRGLRFESAPFRKDLTADNTLYVRHSRSVLSHVEVVGAGRGRFLGRANATSAIETWGVPPRMEHILVENSAYNGINITNPQSLVTIEHANLTNNRGYGLYVNTTHGYVTLSRSSVSDNMGDGVKYHFHDFRPETKLVDGVDVHDFCTYSTTYSQTYPFLMVAEQYGDSSVERHCAKRFYTKHGYLLTLHFTHMVSDTNDGASIEIRDGSDANARLITTVDVRNYTRPESVVTTGNNVFVVFRAAAEVRTEVFMEVTAGRQKAFDLNVTETAVDRNSGRGVWVEWMRSALHVHRTDVTRHNHVAGVHVNWGAGDVNVTHSTIAHNFVDGVNITYGGGARNISWTRVSNNLGMGVAVYLNETTVNYPVRQETTVSYSNISLNYDIGVLVGNFCGPAVVNISGNHFVFGRYIGLEVLSCWRDSNLEGVAEGMTDLFIGHNHFEFNKQVAVKMSPVSRLRGRIEHNDFDDNFEGCVYTFNEDDFILEIQTVELLLQENRFRRNTGSYVLNLGLSHYDHRHVQNLTAYFNWVQNNVVSEPWPGLNPRSEVAAPVVIGSSNVYVRRNLIDNPGSKYELGSRLIEPNTELDCRNNWLGHKGERRVWERVFDRDDRYNLARIAYVPYLLSNNINTELVLERPEWEPEFLIDHEAREVGGEVTGVEELRSDGVYVVRRDINVRPNGRLKVTPGVTLKFEHSIGMMVSGELIAEGDMQGGQPVFTLLDNVRENVSSVPVRLVGGATVREGRLQVQLDGTWGTVCNFGWTIESAALACQQMGWVLNPEDWDLAPIDVPQAGAGGPILLSNVRCDPLDTDLTRCKLSEKADMFLNSCTHGDDVGLRCYDVSWAGVRLGMTAKRSKLYDVKVERAGLYDYRRYLFNPAIQADFSHHVFEHIEVRDNDHDGLGVMYSDIYFPDRVNYISNSRFVDNKRHGISFRQLGMLIEDSEIRGNGRAGVHHDPMLNKLEQRELAEWMSLLGERETDAIINIPESEMGLHQEDPIIIPEGHSRLIVTQAMNDSDVQRTYHVRCERDEFVIGMQLINPFHNYTTESLVVYDYREVRPNDDLVEVWNVSRDIATFPIISSSYAITLVFKPGAAAIGNMMFLMTPINCADLPGNCNTKAYHINPLHRSKIVPGSFPRLTIQRTKISHNEQGLSALHYNRYLGDDSQVYLRKANESIEVFHCEVSSNRREAFHVFTPFRELNQFNISEITYMINHTKFLDNGRGIFQYSKDLRDSNNLYHWVLRENEFERNAGGGFDVALPYVWQYNENHTHTVHIDSNRAVGNEAFGMTVRGHFARVYVVNNTLFDNRCHEGLLALRGMEKESWVFANNIQRNDGAYMVEFETDSHSEIVGFVEAYFTQNIVKNNGHAGVAQRLQAQPASYTVGVKGVQKFNVTENIFSNPGMDYELLAGIRTARISNFLNAEQNYWGTANINRIRERLFDFDDWNSYAITHFLPFYLEPSFEASLSSAFEPPPKIDLDNLGGRLEESLRLVARPGRPYVIKSDLTVMPDTTLTIEPGAELEFFPNVGILVLGTLHAQGNIHQNIVMRPAKIDDVLRAGGRRQQLHSDTKYASGRQDNRGSKFLQLSEEEDFDVRLCTADVNGTVCPENANQGFLEIYNRTTMQWVPICDRRFTERNAQTVCRQLGFSDLNVYLDFDQRIEYNAESLVRIIYWPEPYQCVGTEPRMAHCPLRLNGQIYGHDYVCDWEGKDFAFIHCGSTNLGQDYEYWGGVRFSVKEFEEELFHTRIHDAVTHSSTHRHESILEYVQVVGAGMLHGEKSPAVQAVMTSPLLSYLNISHSAYDGINVISPSGMMNMLYNKLEHNLGVGISAAVLTGEVREAKLSAFEPIDEIPIPYDNFGLVDICDPQKEIAVEERVLLYYKYDNSPVDCVKIFSSVYDVKPIGFRLLQYNLVNSTGEPWIPDHITLYDGDLYNRTTKPMVTIRVDDVPDEGVLHQTTRTNAMSVKFHATGAREHMGFVAEVVTLPFSIVAQNRDLRHNVSFSVFEGNHRGAVRYSSVGENNPIVTMQRNHVVGNCQSLYGNFSTCQSALHLDVQNTQDVFFHNNFLTRNIGGLLVKAGSSGTATAMRAMLHNNVFEDNVKRVTLHFEGRKTTPYQQVTLYRNYVTRSNVSHEAVMLMFQVVCNATYNTFHNNKGKMIVEVTGFHNVRLPIYQSFTHNGFYNNYAYGLHCDQTTLGYCRWGNRATIVAGSAGQEFVDNVFYNLNNDYELMTLNRSVWDVWKTPINAKYNYWAYNETYAVAGRIKDLHDEDGLLEVDFTPFHMNNKTLLSGKCQPGWTLLGDTCYMYLGGPMTYRQAVDFCAKDNATLPTITNFYQYHVLTHYLEQQQEDWRYYDMVWINDLDNDDCNVFVDSTVKSISCDFMLPALCEMDEHVHLVPPTSVYELPKEVVYSSVTLGLMIVLVVLLCCCWCNKTRHRKKERLQRRDSIRMSKSSLGSRSLASMASTGFSDINYRRRFIQQSKSGGGAGTISSTYRSNPAPTNMPAPSASGSQQQIHTASFDSLADKSMAMNSGLVDTSSYAYHSSNPMPGDPMSGSAANLNSLGSHLSPNGGRSSFADTHDVHYAPGGGTTLTFPQVHSASGYDLASSYDNAAYRPETRQSNRTQNAMNTSGVWPGSGEGHDLSSLSQGPPGYRPSVAQPTSGQRPDSVADMKRELKQRLGGSGGSPQDSGDDDLNTTGTTSDASSDPQADRAVGEYQTMDRGYESSTFRPQQPGSSSQPAYPSRSPFSGRALPQTPAAAETIPSVPGYAKPVATPTGTAQRPFHPPPSPPRSRPPTTAVPSEAPRSRRPLLETSLDSDEEDDNGPPHPPRSRSVGQILETNLDDDEQDREDRPVLPNSNGHSRSLGESGFPRMSLGPAASLLETDM